MRYQLVRVKEIERFDDDPDEMEIYEYLSTSEHYKPGTSDEDGSVELVTEVALDELAEYLDSAAENENYHSLVGMHGWLAKAIAKFGGEEAAIRVLRLIAECDGLIGIDDNKDAWRALE